MYFFIFCFSTVQDLKKLQSHHCKSLVSLQNGSVTGAATQITWTAAETESVTLFSATVNLERTWVIWVTTVKGLLHVWHLGSGLVSQQGVHRHDDAWCAKPTLGAMSLCYSLLTHTQKIKIKKGFKKKNVPKFVNLCHLCNIPAQDAAPWPRCRCPPLSRQRPGVRSREELGKRWRHGDWFPVKAFFIWLCSDYLVIYFLEKGHLSDCNIYRTAHPHFFKFKNGVKLRKWRTSEDTTAVVWWGHI